MIHCADVSIFTHASEAQESYHQPFLCRTVFNRPLKELLFDETQPEIGLDDPPGDNVGMVGDAGSKDDEHKGDGDKHEATVAGSHGGKMGQKGENKGDGDKHEPTVAGSDGQKGDDDRKRRANMSPNSKAMAEERRKQKHRENSARWHAKYISKGVPREAAPAQSQEAAASQAAADAPVQEEAAASQAADAPARQEEAAASQAADAPAQEAAEVQDETHAEAMQQEVQEEYQHPVMPTPAISEDTIDQARYEC